MPALRTMGLSDSPASSGFELYYRGWPTECSTEPLHTLYGRLALVENHHGTKPLILLRNSISLYAEGQLTSDWSRLDISPITNPSASIYLNATTRSNISSPLQGVLSLDIYGRIAELASDVPQLYLTRLALDLNQIQNSLSVPRICRQAQNHLSITSDYDDTLLCRSSMQYSLNKTATTPSDRPSWCSGSSDEDGYKDDDDEETDTDEHSPGLSGIRWSLRAGDMAGIVIGIVVFVAPLLYLCDEEERRAQ
ncbi:uncharacterized protein DSM5745_09596 [Aspergillus mulundensis]|uniref:Uncharacterized protein n=1 Tax=Aspergillus mulundensis TaxID=1810919 RepID=A0A3D8QVQ6_9EURO|nr:hypothetical protein DSM5745_09596 [Aspergillus mulundensis]RDW65857.1 hypothetical protein DSM5745_09596 [Aspergillus mulundensis]